MGITRPTGEQLRFRSQYTGDHILDTYLESSEKGSRQLSDLLDDLFDSNGTFRSGNFEFRFDASSDKIQFRAGNFASSTTGWTDITTFFNITGAFNASTTYNNFDLITLTNKDVYIVHGLSSGTTFADEAAVIASANTEKLVDVSEARDWASKTTGQVVSTDYSAKAYAVGGTGIDTTTGSAKDWAIKTSGTIGNTGEYSAKYWATSTAVTTVSSGIANINTVAASISNVNTVASDIANVNTVAGISANVTSVANIDTDVTTVAGISANTTTVAGIAPNVTTVAGVATNVTTVAGISGNVTTVANNSTNVTAVATNVADVNTVAGEINNNNLQTVANDIQAVITLADDLNEATSEIDTVANSITNVDTVGNDITNVNTVATNIANVNTSATNIANVNTVAGISANVTTVAGISADVTTTATNNANITTVAGISSNVTTVAGISSNVTTVAGIAADVTTAATNVVAFNNTYLGAQASAPTADPDGSALDLGDLYFDTTTNTMKVYASSGWTNAGSSVNGTADRFTYTATAGQTTFTGADDSNNTLAYDAGFIDIYMNGVKLAPADYTATSGTSVVLASGAALNDVLEMIAYGTFTLSNQSINDMTDVSTSGVANNNLLAYNSTNSQFEPVSSINFGDNDKAQFGAGNDLQIYHDGSNSFIHDNGTGNLYIRASNALYLNNADNTQVYADFANGGGVNLYHNNASKLSTASYGVQVTGDIRNQGVALTYNENGGEIQLLNSSSNVRGLIDFLDSDNDGEGQMRLLNLSTSDGGVQIGIAAANSVGNISMMTNNLERMRITPGGYVGIGLTAPDNTSEGAGLQVRKYINRNQYYSPAGSYAGSFGYTDNTNTKMWISVDSNYNQGSAETAGLFLSAWHGDANGSTIGYTMKNKRSDQSLIWSRVTSATSVNSPATETEYMRMTSGGTLCLGGNTPSNTLTGDKLFVQGGDIAVRSDQSGSSWRRGALIFDIRNSNGQSKAAYIRSDISSDIHSDMKFFSTVSNTTAERMRIDTQGDVQIGKTDGSQNTQGIILNNYGTIRANSQTTEALHLVRSTTGNIARFYHNNTTLVGNINVDSTGTTYATTSDRRLKTDIQPIEHATDMLMAMNPVLHRWKADPDADAVVGFIAQEMQEIVPEAVSGEPEGDEMMSMDYGRITPILVAALQDAHRKIEELSAEIQALKGA